MSDDAKQTDVFDAAFETAFAQLTSEPSAAAEAGDKTEPTPSEPAAQAEAGRDDSQDRDDRSDRGDGRNARGQFVGRKTAEGKATEGKVKEDDASGAKPQEAGKAAADAPPDKTGAVPDAAAAAKETPAASGTPPPGWSVKSKAEWDRLPAHVRADVLKREQEIAAGFKQYEGLGRFAERARAAGQTLGEALHAYTAIEDLLRRDLGAGLMHIATNAGLTQYQAGQLFADLAQRLGHQITAPAGLTAPAGGSATDQNVAADPQMLQQLIAPAMQPLMQRINSLEQSLRAQVEADQRQRERTAMEAIEQFRRDPANRYYDNVEADIARLLESGVVPRTGNPLHDLAKAYELACWQHPEIREQLINEQLAKAEQQRKQEDSVERAKRASKSINATAAQGISKPAIATDGKDPIDAAIEQAIEMAYRAA